MKRFTTTILAIALLVLTVEKAQAHHPCPPGYTVKWVDQPVTCQKMEWRTRDVPCEVMKPVYREEVRVGYRDIVVPEWRDEFRECTSYSLKPRVVTRDVCRVVMTPVCVVDPCTGCAYTTCKPQTVVEQQSCTVYDPVAVVTKVPVKVCHYRTEKQEFKQTLIHQDWVKEIVTRKESYCVPVTYTTTQKVAVLVPCCP